MQVEIKDNTLIIKLPITEKVSGSGKSLVVASTNGNKETTVQYKGKTLVLGVNAYVKRD